MTIETVNLSSLKRIKNNVIGNPSAKRALAQDQDFIQLLVECLNRLPPSSTDAHGSLDDIRIEAAHVISSISFGSQEALQSLLRTDALQALLYAISNFQPTDSATLKAAFARALRALTVAISETVGPSQWGLRPDTSDLQYEAKAALNYLFQVDCLDIYLPLLIDTSLQTSTSIAQLLASAVRRQSHRDCVTEWLPPADRMKEIKGKRGWEKPDMTNSNAPGRQGGWVARNLTNFLRTRDIKLQEATLSALAALAKDNPTLANVLSRPSSDPESPSPLSVVLSLSKTRSTDVQIAACLCASHIIRAGANNHSTLMDDSTSALSIIHVVNRMIASPNESAQNRTKACFILNYLVTDDLQLCKSAFEQGSLTKLGNLANSITPLDQKSEWEEDEPENTSCLREAALRAIAALCLFDHDPRIEVTDKLHMIPTLLASLSHRHVGVRYAACQCVRVLSRAVKVIRTSISDNGLGTAVFQIFKKQDEDRNVTNAALSAISNIVIEFSPLRPVFMADGLVDRLIQLLNTQDPDFRLNSLWLLKNLVYKMSIETKKKIMAQLGWPYFSALLVDPDDKIQEQAFWIAQNLAENEDGVDLVFRELGPEALLRSSTTALYSPHEEVILPAARVMANLANGYENHQDLIISNPQILKALRYCMSEANVEARRPAVSCILQLIRANPQRRQEFQDTGIISTLRHMCDWSGGVGISPGARMLGHHNVVEDDKEVIDLAREALDRLDHGDIGF